MPPNKCLKMQEQDEDGFAPLKEMETGTRHGSSAQDCQEVSGGATKSGCTDMSAGRQLCAIELDDAMKPDDTSASCPACVQSYFPGKEPGGRHGCP